MQKASIVLVLKQSHWVSRVYSTQEYNTLQYIALKSTTLQYIVQSIVQYSIEYNAPVYSTLEYNIHHKVFINQSAPEVGRLTGCTLHIYYCTQPYKLYTWDCTLHIYYCTQLHKLYTRNCTLDCSGVYTLLYCTVHCVHFGLSWIVLF